ncbi:MAG: phosphate ABC transporter permease, partial [Deltaproteobacteria bacterium]|nr:phosphate ABC transporter permease [Deltaproteobacteria bacterium]
MPKTSDRLLTAWVYLSGGGVLTAVALLVGFLMVRGLPGVGPTLFFGDTPWLAAVLGQQPVFDGIWPALVGTTALVILASAISIPVGLAGGVYLAEYASRGVKTFLGFMVDLLSG